MIAGIQTSGAVECCPDCGFPWYDCICRPGWLNRLPWKNSFSKGFPVNRTHAKRRRNCGRFPYMYLYGITIRLLAIIISLRVIACNRIVTANELQN
jgi:hypothetical protein